MFHSAQSSFTPDAARTRDVYRRLRDLALRLQDTSDQTQSGLADVFRELNDLNCVIDKGDDSAGAVSNNNNNV